MEGERPSEPAEWASQSRNRVSLVFSPSLPASCLSSQPLRSPENDAGKPDVAPVHHANNKLPSTSTSHHQSISNVPAANPLPTHFSSLLRFTHPLAYQSYSSAHTASSPFPPRIPQEQLSTSPGPDHSHYPGRGAFTNAHNFSVTHSTFIENTTIRDDFMKDLLRHTIIGAAFNSSARVPFPQCHPGTRISITKRCLDFVTKSNGREKLRWVVGPAGVGKSAVMQFVAENVPSGVVCASVFLSVDGRQDGTKLIATIAYELAVKCGPYRQFIRNEVSLDPALLHTALSVQFDKFIVEPIIRQHLFDFPCRILILIDGLDECDDPLMQLGLLQLISNCCITHPTSPVVWIVSSRPEPHITSFFEAVKDQLPYIKEGIEIESDEAGNDVQLYLRDELNKIKLASPMLKYKENWPAKPMFTRIATAAGGFFGYASTVVRYISNPSHANPVTPLIHVVAVIEGTKLRMSPGKDHPMDHLDALYTRIISKIPVHVEQDTRQLLLLCLKENQGSNPFRLQCNLLGLTEYAANDATHYTHSVVKVPKPENADKECLRCLHNSFEHYLSDFERSKLFRNAQNEVDELVTQISLRVVEEVPHDIDAVASAEGICGEDGSYLKGSLDACATVSLSWPGDERFTLTDDQLKIMMYRHAVADVAFRFRPGRTAFANLSCFRVLTTRFTAPGSSFRHYELQCFAFDHFRRELTELEILKQVPLRTLDYAAICGGIDLRFTSPAGTDTGLPDPWNPSCKHEKLKIDDLEGRQGWTTKFGKSLPIDPSVNQDPVDNNVDTLTPRPNCFAGNSSHDRSPHVELSSGVEHCHHCLHRLSLHIVNHSDQLATVFVDSTNMCYVELSINEPDDVTLHWRYRFCHSGPPTCLKVW